MPEIFYKDVNAYLKDSADAETYPVYLLHGEELLYKKALNAFLERLLPAARRDLNAVSVDGIDGNIFDAIEQVKTYSLLSGPKVVSLLDSKLFYSKQDTTKLMEKAKAAYDKDDLKKAAGSFVGILAILELDFEDLEKPKVKKKLTPAGGGDDKWLDDLIRHCREQGVSIPRAGDAAGTLEKTIEGGFPKGNTLFVTTDIVDKRKSLYKALSKKGLVVDCSVPKGGRKTDKEAQESVLADQMKEILDRNEKTIDPDAFHAIRDLTGFDLRVFNQNIEKIVDFVGEKRTISVEDVDAVLSRTKVDPIYELTNAVAERDLHKSLFHVKSLLSDNYYPLQILAAMINQVRKMIMAKSFLESDQAGAWHPGINFWQFKSSVIPALKSFDAVILKRLDAWGDALLSDEAVEGEARKPKKKQQTDLLVAKNPNNPYPIYLLLQRSHSLSMRELMRALDCLSQADMRLKSGGQNAMPILEAAVFCICQGDK